MNATQMRLFSEPDIAASVLLAGGDDFLQVDESGVLTIPQGAEVEGFHLVVAVGEVSRTFVVQKDVGTTGGDYTSEALSRYNFGKGFRAVIMRDPIEVIHAGGNIWTGWHKNAASNRVDCWHLGKAGKLDLFQVGVLTHDNGKTFRLHGEYRWRGQLYQMNGMLVGRPAHAKWGSLEGGTSKRTQIFDHPDFSALLDDVKRLPTWDGDESELDPPLPGVPEGDFAVIDWFISCAGQTGQGIAKSKDGNPAWVHGCDVAGFDPNNVEPLLWHGDIVSYTDVVQNWGAKKNGPPKLAGVKLVKRDW